MINQGCTYEQRTEQQCFLGWNRHEGDLSSTGGATDTRSKSFNTSSSLTGQDNTSMSGSATIILSRLGSSNHWRL
uniref:Uncharacterized protein n=1 Tax=Arundo donax TaxID=35708 RepID=A0A0A9A4T7_ARUDO